MGGGVIAARLGAWFFGLVDAEYGIQQLVGVG